MSTVKERLSNFIDVRNERNPLWIPARLRGLIRRISGGDSWTAQMLRGLLWQYRWLVGLALAANIAAAVFEGSTMAVFTLALQALAGDLAGGPSISLGIFDPFVQELMGSYESSRLFMIFIGLAVVSQLLRSGLQFGGQVAAAYLLAWMEGDLRRRLFRQFVSVSYPEISRYKIGDLISYVEQIVRVGSLINNVNKLLGDGLLVLAYVSVLLWLSWPMTLAAVGALLILMSTLRGINAKLRALSERFMNASITFNESILEYLQGIRLVHTFGRKEYVLETIEPVVVDSVQARRQGSVRYATITPIYQSLTVIGVAAFLLLGYIWMGSDLSAIPRLLTFVFVLYRLLPFVTVMSNTFASIYDSMPFVNRIAEILRVDDKEFTSSGNQPITRLSQDIEFNNVTLRYPETERDAIHDMTLKISQGKMTAFVGASGSGKSSIVSLLMRLYDPTDGQILIDGLPIDKYDLDQWRALFGIVDQDTFIFNASVANNIRFGNLKASQADVEEAARISNAHNFIRELHNGYETAVGDRGFRLSGGQRQRIAIARAVVRQPSILLFDEATSALDSQSERLIQEHLENLRLNRTLIVIAHRLSTVVMADTIFVLEDGQLLEQGTHSELIRKNGRYASLWKLQSEQPNEKRWQD